MQYLDYDYDNFGNLAARYDKMRNLRETFGYDGLDRLDSIWLNNVHTGLTAYDALGRMTDKMVDGQQVFSSAQHNHVGPDGQLRPHAISSAQVQGNPFPTEQLDIEYTMFDKVRGIDTHTGKMVGYEYGYDHQRIRQVTANMMWTKMKTYIGNCERIDEAAKSPVYRTYLSGPLGVFAVVETENGVESLHYVLKDHLGSWTTITDANGNIEQEQSFDAWGNMRDPETWTGTVTQQPMFDRGYTGHEHLNNFGLINMNGRMYDPVMSSFLSVDNYVQCPDFSQNFNRYAYCLNNPLKYTDPSGESVTLLAAVAIGAAVSMVSTATMNFIYDRPLYEGLGRAAIVGALQGAFSFGIGAAAGVVNTAVTSATSSTWGTVAQVSFQALAHGTLAGVSSELRNEGSFWQGFASGAAASLISGAVGGACDLKKVPAVWAKAAMIAAGGIAGGVSSKIAGGEFIDGFCNGLISAGLNHAMHWVAKNVTGPDDPPGKQNTRASTGNKNVAKLKEDLMKGGQAGGGVATAVNGASELSKMTRLAQFSKSLGGAFVVVSEIPDAIDFVNDPSLGTGTKLLIGVGLGVATVFGGPVVATGAFVLGVVNAYGGFDSYYDQLNNLNIHDTQNTK